MEATGRGMCGEPSYCLDGRIHNPEEGYSVSSHVHDLNCSGRLRDVDADVGKSGPKVGNVGIGRARMSAAQVET